MEIVNLKLPEFAFLSGSEQPGSDILCYRTVICHIPTATVMEIFDTGKVCLKPEVKKYRFIREAPFHRERLTVALHYSATIDEVEDLMTVLKKCAAWYCDYSDWEDLEILSNEKI